MSDLMVGALLKPDCLGNKNSYKKWPTTLNASSSFIIIDKWVSYNMGEGKNCIGLKELGKGGGQELGEKELQAVYPPPPPTSWVEF